MKVIEQILTILTMSIGTVLFAGLFILISFVQIILWILS